MRRGAWVGNETRAKECTVEDAWMGGGFFYKTKQRVARPVHRLHTHKHHRPDKRRTGRDPTGGDTTSNHTEGSVAATWARASGPPPSPLQPTMDALQPDDFSASELYPLAFDAETSAWYVLDEEYETRQGLVDPSIYQGHISLYDAQGEEADAAADVDHLRVRPNTASRVADVHMDDLGLDLLASDEEYAKWLSRTFAPSLFDDDILELLRCWHALDQHVQCHSVNLTPDQTQESCPICLEPYGTSIDTRTCVFAQCGHHVCCGCLHNDFTTRMKNSCVMCRQPVYTPPRSVSLQALLTFANNLSMDLIELEHWPLPRAYGRYFTRWLWAYVGGRKWPHWPRDGPWAGSRGCGASRCSDSRTCE